MLGSNPNCIIVISGSGGPFFTHTVRTFENVFWFTYFSSAFTSNSAFIGPFLSPLILQLYSTISVYFSVSCAHPQIQLPPVRAFSRWFSTSIWTFLCLSCPPLIQLSLAPSFQLWFSSIWMLFLAPVPTSESVLYKSLPFLPWYSYLCESVTFLASLTYFSAQTLQRLANRGPWLACCPMHSCSQALARPPWCGGHSNQKSIKIIYFPSTNTIHTCYYKYRISTKQWFTIGCIVYQNQSVWWWSQI
jgi:hypothetical protein